MSDEALSKRPQMSLPILRGAHTLLRRSNVCSNAVQMVEENEEAVQ